MNNKPKRLRLPELTCENLRAVMRERIAATKNERTAVPMLWQGYLELPIGAERTAAYYVPQDTPQGTTVVAMNIPEGDTLSFWEESGWLALAEEQGFCLYALEPGKHGWGSAAGEADYVRDALDALKCGQYLLAAFAVHLVGYGPIGTQLHKLAMADPLHTAAAVFFDASDVDAETLAAFREKEYVSEDKARGDVLRVPYRDVPVPVWIASARLDEQTADTAAYWKTAAHAGDAAQDARFGTVFRQNADSEYTREGHILKVAVQERAYAYADPETTARAFAFLMQYYRYGMGPRSNTVSRKVDLKAMGVEHHRFTDRNGIEREYLVYVPSAYRDGKKKLPAVLSFHGASQSMRNMLENGMWYHLADEQGIVLVFPESTLQPMPQELARGMALADRPLWMLDDTESAAKEGTYVGELLDRLLEEYPVDPGRIYGTGHSMGCMMTNYLGSTPVGQRFAALGGTSGCLRVKGEGGGKVPVFFTDGQYELWNYDFNAPGPIGDMVSLWLEQNGLRRDVCEQSVTGRFHNTVWKDEAGIPWLRYAWVFEKHHVHTYWENRVFWEEWFSRWTLAPDGSRCYRE